MYPHTFVHGFEYIVWNLHLNRTIFKFSALFICEEQGVRLKYMPVY